MKSTLTSKGQVTVPAKIREALGICEGDKLDFRLREDGKLEVAVVAGRLDDLKGVLPAPRRRLSLAEMEDAIGQGGES
jgi:antitoxin PrlF